jgi:uncharacterized protein (TIGR01777 family)
MNILITGGTGLIGRALTKSFQEDGHKVWALSRNPAKNRNRTQSAGQLVAWDGRSATGWGELVNEMDVIINLAGVNTASWPWTNAKKQSFWNSRVRAGQAVLEAIRSARKKPSVVIQASGINHYGLHGDTATESSAPGDDFLARLTVPWEDSTKPVEEIGVRRAVIRTAVVLTRDNIIMKLMELPATLFVGGRLGNGRQTLPWIHLADEVAAIRYIIDHEQMNGVYNLIAPESTTNAEFLRTLAKVIHRPFWFHIPAGMMRLVLGEMSVMVLEGRPAKPQRLLDFGYHFKFATLGEALRDLYHS